jgi:hypothetical protein
MRVAEKIAPQLTAPFFRKPNIESQLTQLRSREAHRSAGILRLAKRHGIDLDPKPNEPPQRVAVCGRPS